MKKIKEEYFYKNEEFYNIISDIITNDSFCELKKIRHHGISRYNHSLRVAYHTFKVTKKLRLNYVEATRAAMLHDFFFDEVSEMSSYKALRKHPQIAVENSQKYFELTDLQRDIIKKHMFPITISLPRHIESWVVDIVDDVASVYERTYSLNNEFGAAINFIFLCLMIKFR